MEFGFLVVLLVVAAIAVGALSAAGGIRGRDGHGEYRTTPVPSAALDDAAVDGTWPGSESTWGTPASDSGGNWSESSPSASTDSAAG
jgi:hypothetical protein